MGEIQANLAAGEWEIALLNVLERISEGCVKSKEEWEYVDLSEVRQRAAGWNEVLR